MESVSQLPHDARSIANFFLDYADTKGMPLTIMALLKLIYFAHGWHLANLGRPLVKNRFEAWPHGPVVRAVYESFQGSGKKPIRDRATRFDPRSGQAQLATYSLTRDEMTFLSQIFDAYAPLHAYRLSDMTHEAGSPWEQLQNAENTSTSPGMLISNDSIRAHFLRPGRRNFGH